MKTFVEFLAEKYDLIDEANNRYGKSFRDAIIARARLSDEEKHKLWQDQERDKSNARFNNTMDKLRQNREQDQERDKLNARFNNTMDKLRQGKPKTSSTNKTKVNE